MAQVGQCMMLVNSTFRNAKSFTLIPVSLDSPYVEAMFDPASGILAVISKVMKQSYHMVAKLDDNGDEVPVKGKPRANGKKVKEERRMVATFSEHYIVTEEEIREIINMFAINPKAFDLDEFFSLETGSNLITPKMEPITTKA